MSIGIADACTRQIELSFFALSDRPQQVELARAADGLPPHWEQLARDVRLCRDAQVFNPAAKRHKIGRFDGVKLIGFGGVGVVFEVEDPLLDRRVALKLCKNIGPSAGAALLTEAQLLARLSHPNVVTVHEAGHHGDEVFYVMELVNGCSAHDYFRECRRWQDAVDVYAAAGRGLAAAHDRGIVHGDFKPGNILVGDDGRVRVADFGLARVIADHRPAAERRRGQIGTPVFMAPELLRGEPGDARSDQFSFCVSLWQLLYGARPFVGETCEQLLASIEAGDRRIGQPLQRVPRRLRAILDRGLAADPSLRHPDMHALVGRLIDLPETPVTRRVLFFCLVGMCGVGLGGLLGKVGG